MRVEATIRVPGPVFLFVRADEDWSPGEGVFVAADSGDLYIDGVRVGEVLPPLGSAIRPNAESVYTGQRLVETIVVETTIDCVLDL